LLIRKRARTLIHSKLWTNSSGHACVRVVLATSLSKQICRRRVDQGFYTLW